MQEGRIYLFIYFIIRFVNIELRDCPIIRLDWTGFIQWKETLPDLSI